MIEVDRLMIEAYHISLTQMMENAGRNLADLSQILLGGSVGEKSIAVVCGGGNNGGGGMAAARHLSNRGAKVTTAISVSADHLKSIPLDQMRAIKKMGVRMIDTFPMDPFDLVIDALIGYGLQGAPRGRAAEWIEGMNEMEALKLALDIPSGLDADTGTAIGRCVRADATMTLALPKQGYLNKSALKFIGDLYAADISVVRDLLEATGITSTDLFQDASIVRLIT